MNEQLIKDVLRWIITTKNTEMLDESDIDMVYKDYVNEKASMCDSEHIAPVVRSNATTGWIRTEERLPKHEQIVDIFYEGTRFTDCMFCDYKDSTPIHFYDERYDRIIELEDVEFWMPLPELPEV